MEQKIVVAGAGLAGLAAAATAARAGARVLVLDEKSPGGRARTDETDGFRFNRGPHAIYLGGPGRKVLTRLGVRPAMHAPPLRGTRVLAGGGLHPPLSRRVLGLRAAAQLTAVLARIARTDSAACPVTSTRDWISSLELAPKAAAMLEFGVRVSTYTARVIQNSLTLGSSLWRCAVLNNPRRTWTRSPPTWRSASCAPRREASATRTRAGGSSWTAC